MATDKNARVEEGNWALIKPVCHPEAPWVLHHSIATGLYTLVCGTCHSKLFSVMIQPKQW